MTTLPIILIGSLLLLRKKNTNKIGTIGENKAFGYIYLPLSEDTYYYEEYFVPLAEKLKKQKISPNSPKGKLAIQRIVEIYIKNNDFSDFFPKNKISEKDIKYVVTELADYIQDIIDEE